MSNFGAILTNAGAAKLANAIALGVPLKLTKMAVGDGNGQPVAPDPAMTAIPGEKRRAAINTLFADPLAASQLVAEQIIPEDVGGWWIRCVGLYDDSNTLIAIANVPDTYKPLLTSGAGRTQIIRMVLIVSDTSAVELKIDPSVVLATRKYVEDVMKDHKESRDHPYASQNMPGFMRFASKEQTEEGSADDVAVTPKKLIDHYKKSNILGAVGLLAGVPTGAVIESGSNANGSYMKLANGWMVVVKNLVFPLVTMNPDTFQVLTIGGETSWPWPAKFSAGIPMVSIQFVGPQSYAFQVQAENITEAAVGSFHLRNSWIGPLPTTPSIHVIAIGKW